MNSGGHRGFTVVTIVTLIFAPFFSHHEWMWGLVGKTKETHIAQCAPEDPCPAKNRIVTIVRQPAPSGGQDQGGGDNNGGDNNGGDEGGHGGSGEH
jgi:uncharacterized membrane protein YgcG